MPQSVSIRLDLRDDPDFQLIVPVRRKTAVQGSDATFGVSTHGLGTYDDDIDLDAGGLPEGTDFSFGTDPIGYNSSTDLTIDTTELSVGSYNFTVNASIYTPPVGSITAASASNADIQTAINAASDGYTVYVPAGTVTWTGDVSIPATKGIKLIGAGTGLTNINANSTYHLYLDTRSTNSPVRVSGFTFSYTPGNFLRINYRHSGADDFRIDHCDFDNASAIPIFIAGWTFGVIDNCNFNNQVRAIFIEGRADDIDGGYAGGYSWSHPLTLGSADMVYIEDCYINNTISYPGQAIDCNAGGRYCFRYNTLEGWEGIETHSACTPSNAGYSYRNSRWAEIYENTLNVNTAGTRWLGAWFRSCNGMAYNNAFSSGYTSTVVFDNETTCYTTCGGVWAKTQEQIDAITYPYQDQIGVGMDSGFGTAQATDEAKLWIFNNTRAGSFSAPTNNLCAKAAEIAQADRDYFLQVTPFTGASGVGVGLLSARPSSGLTTGVYYWATDTSTLYRATGATTWVTHYTPYTYPHPLRSL